MDSANQGSFVRGAPLHRASYCSGSAIHDVPKFGEPRISINTEPEAESE